MPSARIPNGIGKRDARSWVSNPSVGAMTWLRLRRRLKYLPMSECCSWLWLIMYGYVCCGILLRCRCFAELGVNGSVSEVVVVVCGHDAVGGFELLHFSFELPESTRVFTKLLI